MIISLYASGMTLRDIQQHLALTTGTELSMRRRPKSWISLPSRWRAGGGGHVAVVSGDYLDASVVKVRDGAHGPDKATQIAVDLGKTLLAATRSALRLDANPGLPLARCAGRTG
jgi:putative transposase